MTKPILIILNLFMLNGCKTIDNQPQLWYDKPAAEWNEALPVGNGRLGAMIYGDPHNECIQINEESIWAGSKINNNNPDALKNLPALRDAIFRGDIESAEKIASEHFIGTPPRIRSYQPLGELLINYSWNGPVSDYKRSLNIQSGIASTMFKVGNYQVIEKVFASAADNILVINIKSGRKGQIDASFELKREKDADVRIPEVGEICLSGQIDDTDDSLAGPGGKHMRFAGKAVFRLKNGSFTREANKLKITGATEITILFTAATDYNIDLLDFDNNIDPDAVCRKILENASSKGFDELINAHISEHRSMFDRTSLDFGPDTLTSIPVNKRIDRLKEGMADNGLIALYFQYGRYLLMGSSRKPAVLPSNLQGIWNKEYNAPWNSDFHTNINLQMNYWPAEVCNLSETSLVLAEFVKRLTVPGSITAKEMYGTRGWTIHHLTDPFGRTGVADGLWGLTPTDGPWLTLPVYEHFLFTRDYDYLRNTAYPIIRGSTEFILDFLTLSPEGYLVTNPSTSPENRYFLPDSQKPAYLTYAATIDVQTVKKVLDNCSEAANILRTDSDLVKKINDVIAKLPPVKINSFGAIQEWIKDFKETEPGHRHMSHLLGLYPLDQITPDTPELYEAAAKTIARRLSYGGGHTGWSRAWIINFYARLHNGDEAYNHIINLLSKSTLVNLFDTHPPFQIDGNFGATAGIAEMLLQSHQDFIELLPALPTAWNSGTVKGLVARGNFVVDISWNNHRLTWVKIHSGCGGKCRIKYCDKYTMLDTKKGRNYFPVKKLLN